LNTEITVIFGYMEATATSYGSKNMDKCNCGGIITSDCSILCSVSKTELSALHRL